MTVRDPDLVQIINSLQADIDDLKKTAISRWGRVPHVATDPTSPPDGSVWIRSDRKRLQIQANGSSIDVDAAFGFRVYKSVNEAAWGTAQAHTVTFDKCDQFAGGWVVPTAGNITPTASFTVPAGGAGSYVFHAGAYWAAFVAGIYWSIRCNGVALANNAFPTLVTDTGLVSGALYLAVGDVIDFYNFNNSGGNITVTAIAGTVNNPVLPYLSVWRTGT